MKYAMTQFDPGKLGAAHLAYLDWLKAGSPVDAIPLEQMAWILRYRGELERAMADQIEADPHAVAGDVMHFAALWLETVAEEGGLPPPRVIGALATSLLAAAVNKREMLWTDSGR